MGADVMIYMGAIALGALHAFEPGHGKTVIAAYMLGSRGRTVDGVILGIITTFTHTFSVIILGVIATLLSRTFSADQLHAWLGIVSSILILAVGIWMLRDRLKGSGGHKHFHLFGKNQSHDHQHHSHNHDHEHKHTSGSHDHAQEQTNNRWNLLMLGISGGLVPCSAGIATLLAAIGAGRIAQGLTVALFFSLGLGLVMMIIGVTLSQAGKLTTKINASPEFSRRMGIVSAIIITTLGCFTLVHSLQSIV
jgi:nickel/cobalt exporter